MPIQPFNWMPVLGLLVIGGISGCATPSTETSFYNQQTRDALRVAAATGTARDLAHWLQVDLQANKTVADADKADLRARAQVLDAEADRLAIRLEHADLKAMRPGDVPVSELVEEAKELERQHRALFREWTVWQVRFGIRKPEDILPPGPSFFAEQ